MTILHVGLFNRLQNSLGRNFDNLRPNEKELANYCAIIYLLVIKMKVSKSKSMSLKIPNDLCQKIMNCEY